MLRLKTLGPLELRTSGGATVGLLLAQPRSMALLVYLLLAHPREYLRRDTLCALFWPDADDEHARGALSQALSRIRRTAGTGILELQGKDAIRVVPGTVACDALAFEEAVANGDCAVAIDLYAGPFLDGFHAAHAPGFEQWAETERGRLRSLAARAARTRAGELIAHGRLPEAEQAVGRALELAPESEVTAGELMRALSDAGNRAGALRLYDGWVAALEHDFELQPSAGVQMLAREIRASGAVTNRDRAAGPPAGSHESTRAQPASSAPSAHRAPDGWWRRRRIATGATAALAFLLGAWGLVQAGLLPTEMPVEASGRAPIVLRRQDWLIVTDFESPSVDPALALAFQTLLIRDLESAGYTSVIGGIGALSRRPLEEVLARMRLPPTTRVDADLACAIAEREGTAGVLAGRVLPLGPKYVLAVSFLDVPECKELIRASTVADFDDLSGAVAAVSKELRTRLGESRASIRRSPPLSPITARYIDALRAVSHYISTPELWSDESRGAAVLQDALRFEPDLAFAHFLLALHHQRAGRYEQAVPHILSAYEFRSQLPRGGRLGMEAIYQRYIASDPRAAIAKVRSIVNDYPAWADVTLPFLADAELWTGNYRGALEISSMYLARRPGGLGAHLGIVRASAAAAALGRGELADSFYRMGVSLQREAGLAPDRTMMLQHHLLDHDWDAAASLCLAHPAWDRCGYVQLARGRLDAAASVLGAALVADTAHRQAWSRAALSAALAHTELTRNRPDSAWQLLQRADRSMSMVGVARAGTHIKRFVLCAAAAELHRSSEFRECRIEQEDPARWDRDPSFTIVLRSGAWSRRLLAVRSLERGDAAAALRQASEAVRNNFGNAGTIDHLIQARAFDALSQRDSALAHYIAATRIERDCCFPTTAGIGFPIAPIYRRIAELAEDGGDPVTARRYYGAFVQLWAQADPELQPQVRAVQARIAKLQD